ncbi:MAG TPA: hypothetical protein VD995_00570 [Azospirillum sp.]|nr:hypothetical protein [Azospirillum sp.]
MECLYALDDAERGLLPGLAAAMADREAHGRIQAGNGKTTRNVALLGRAWRA